MNGKFTQTNMTDEEWSMPNPNKNLPPNETLIEPIEEWSMTGKLVLPHQDSLNGWKMPEPKFRATSGTLPEKYVKKTQDIADLDTQPLDLSKVLNNAADQAKIEPVNTPPPPPPIQAAVFEQPVIPVPIEPQPDVAEVFATAQMPSAAPVEEKIRSKSMQMFLAILGLSAMVFFAVAFLVIVYFLFFYKTATE